MRWLSAHTYELDKHGCGNGSMSNKFNVLEQALLDVLEELSLFADEDFMMNFFNAVADAVTEFSEFKQCKYNEKKQIAVDSN